MPKTSADTTLRYLAMLQIVPAAPGRISVAALGDALRAREYDVTPRTLQRDLERLSAVFPMSCDREGRANHWYFTDKTALLQIPAMGDATALALKLAEDYLSPIMPLASLRLLQPYFRHAQEVLDKTRLGKWRSKVKIIRRGPQLIPPAIRPGVQEAVYQALLEGKQLQVSYKGRGKKDAAERVLNPLGVVAREGVFYLIATAWNYEDVRHFALHRITKAEVTDIPARTPAGLQRQHLPLAEIRKQLEPLGRRGGGGAGGAGRRNKATEYLDRMMESINP